MHPLEPNPNMNPSRRHALLALALALAGVGIAHAADVYPARPVRIVVPFAAGGSGDAVTRIVAQRLGARMGQPFLVDNRPGAGGATGEGIVAKSAPDGYTLSFVSAGHAWLAATNPNLNFDPSRDLSPVALICSIPYVFLARTDAPFKTVPEFIAYAKAHPGAVTLASAGVGTLTHLLPAWLSSETGVELNHIPYGGTAPAMNSLVSGQTDVYFDPVATSMPYVRSGKVRALATTSATRPATARDVPTLLELGYKVTGSTWFALMAPAGTPRSLIDRLNGEVNAVLQDAEVKRRLMAMDFNIDATSVDGFAAFLAKETQQWTRIVRDNHIKSD
jgi:tripartite-type tricarboxylate transporter receptor subunit TctC